MSCIKTINAKNRVLLHIRCERFRKLGSARKSRASDNLVNKTAKCSQHQEKTLPNGARKPAPLAVLLTEGKDASLTKKITI